MNDNEQTSLDQIEIPGDAIVVLQSNWAWMWSAAPWVVLFGIATVFDFFTFGVLPMVLAAIVIIPSYMSFRKTAYILTDTHVIIQQGTLFGAQKIDLGIERLSEVLELPGMFGRSLGYTAVHLVLKDGRVALLRYVPLSAPLAQHVRSRIVD
tara:strand:- start:1381 stop:1836 length:456 start_codon:yes stop_codon:yes gene_type:complete